MPREVRVKEGSPFKQSDAERIAQEVDRLIGDGEGITAEELLEAQRPKNAPLHDLIEWNKDKAAYQHQLSQARQIMRSIEVKYVNTDDDGEGWMRQYHVVRPPDAPKGGGGHYTSIDRVSRSENYLAQIRANALREWKAWERRYQQYLHLPELALVLAEIERTFTGTQPKAVAANEGGMTWRIRNDNAEASIPNLPEQRNEPTTALRVAYRTHPAESGGNADARQGAGHTPAYRLSPME